MVMRVRVSFEVKNDSLVLNPNRWQRKHFGSGSQIFQSRLNQTGPIVSIFHMWHDIVVVWESLYQCIDLNTHTFIYTLIFLIPFATQVTLPNPAVLDSLHVLQFFPILRKPRSNLSLKSLYQINLSRSNHSLYTSILPTNWFTRSTLASTSKNSYPQTQTKSQQVIIPMTSTRTIPPTFKPNKQKIKGKRKCPEAVASSTVNERSWVWEHFMTINKPIFKVIDKKKV